MRLSYVLALLPLALAKVEPVAVNLQHPDPTVVPQTFVNTAVARTVELGGSAPLITTQYNVKALVDSPGDYVLALAGKGGNAPAWFEVLVAGKAVQVESSLVDGAPSAVVSVGDLKKDDTVTISLNALQAHATRPLPPAIAQREPQLLLWETKSTYVDSAYTSEVERIKIRSPTPQIVQHGKVPPTYTKESDVTKSGSTITLGPFHSVPPTIGEDAKAEQSPFYVHYETRDPIVGIRTLKRAAEVSHWGGNLNIQDEIDLFNDGPALKGQFSRLAHQQSRFHATKPAQVLSEITLRVPPAAHSVYYYDTIGNVSTSHFRAGQPGQAAPSGKRRGARAVDGVLELRPRYPVLGGWNYSFVVGWDSPLAESLHVEKSGKQVLSVPFLTPMKDVIVDDAQLRVVLPDGANDVEVFTPFPVDSIDYDVMKTYLDTTGRIVVTISKSLVTENHAQPVFIAYSYPLTAQLQKPLAIAVIAGVLLVSFMFLRRVDYNLTTKAERKSR